jgi:hypothetical protein
MVRDGLFDRFPCDAIFGMHNRPGLAIGKFQIRTGPMMVGGAYFDIVVTGEGAHGARPEAGIDPVIVASHITTALQTIVSRNVTPIDTAVLSITQIHAGDAYNVIPERAFIRGTARAFSTETLALIERNMGRIASGIAVGFGATAELDFRLIFPPLINDAIETELIAETAAELVGAGNVNRNGNLVMASEDFSYMLNCRPGAYIQIGNGDEAARAAFTIRATILTTRHCRSAPVCSPDWPSENWRLTELPGFIVARPHTFIRVAQGLNLHRQHANAVIVTRTAIANSPASMLVAALCAAEILGMAGFSIFSALLPPLTREWDLSGAEAGWIRACTTAETRCLCRS